ncbi:acyl-CoA dehydrogenase [Sediminicurvatus halobius]|uniref:Acyl-coenzyme A dehydrogenase n=1 Tax=Sediminicurvatus halobius TaxID=2182432 RepID=A0A2U2N5A0_9GAMM|nr:acyl-CoA dehydrogenase [Spiribacter halobius]PWG64346.1 acyl-CoA dehydrogenase [Spiribacter halobius]UEX79308.1 acyl-CoA dehydrogenase [Spiribacter halobius]
MLALIWLLLFLALLGALAFARTRLSLNTLAIAGYLLALTLLGGQHWAWGVAFWAVFLTVAVPLNTPSLRRRLLTDRLFDWFRSVLPEISETERAALDAGTVWWDGELFSGHPDWRRLLRQPPARLTEAEQAFLDGPTETLCGQVDEWEVSHQRLDLPPAAWETIRGEGFFGLIIPAAHGGKGFSASAHSAVVMRLASRSADLGSTVMVPNSLGPAELLMRYGTDAQQRYYLPRLARGEEIPCFALTGPWAGSDAGSLPDTGVVCRGEWQGEEVLGLRLNWEKRYITLGPVATLLGLAFRAYDPDHLLGESTDLGITLALIPTDLPGVEIGRRHLPLNAAFMNGPNRGRDVFIPLTQIIGGAERIGQGWRMLMNCLAVGRSISLPAGSVATAKMCALTTGAYARIREQFRVPIGEFEGVQEALARIAGNAYVCEAARRVTAAALDAGEEPAVLSAVVKYHLTERQRECINDAMDVHGGKGICLGPSNYLGRSYQTTPISITVEGSNILTRNMMIFGQGAIRCHPFVLKEIEATGDPDPERGRASFDRLLVGHVGHSLGCALRALLLGLSGARLARGAGSADTRPYFRQLERYAAAFALLADASMLVLGGGLKRRERISARLGDMLSHLYLASATLKRYEDDGRPREDLAFVSYGIEQSLALIEQRLDEVIANFPVRPLAWLLRGLVLPLGRRRRGPDDRLAARVARLMMEPGEPRERLIDGVYRPTDAGDAIGAVERAYALAHEVAPLERRLRKAVRSGELRVAWDEDAIGAGERAGVLGADEAERLREAEAARLRVISVDDFDPQELARSAG